MLRTCILGVLTVTALIGAIEVDTDVNFSNAMLHLRHRYHLLSFPCSGRTWLIRLLNNAGLTVGMSHGEPTHHHPQGLTGQQLFDQFKENVVNVPFQNVILLIRDPLDVMVCSYYERKFRGLDSGYDDTIPDGMSLEEFIKRGSEKGGSLFTYVSFLHVWLSIHLGFQGLLKNETGGQHSDAVIVSYEALSQCPHQVLNHVLNEKFNLNVNRSMIRRAVASASFSRMQADEVRALANVRFRRNSLKIRRGQPHAGFLDVHIDTERYIRNYLWELMAPEIKDTFYDQIKVCYSFDA